jgi:hypothetical protein
MPHPKIVREGASVVVLGRFNPAIYHPSWFIRHELVPSSAETENSAESPTIVTPDFCRFNLGVGLVFDATTTRLQFSTDQLERQLVMGELVLNFFTVLEHTPVEALGINRLMHFRLGSPGERDCLGRALAPPSRWSVSKLENPLMRSLSMQGTRKDSAGMYQLTIEPSVLEEIPSGFGVFVLANEHFRATANESAATFVKRVHVEFHPALEFGLLAAESILMAEYTNE